MELSLKVKAPRYSPAQWEAQKLNVERLYISEERPLKEVLQILAHEFGFQASEKQLKSRLPKWGFDVKNLKGDKMVQLARVRAKRRLENKGSSFRVSKKPVDDQKIERYLRRHEITEDYLLAMASPERAASPSYSVFTPRESVRSLTPDASPYSDLLRSPTRGLNFQSLSIIDEQPDDHIMENMIAIIEDPLAHLGPAPPPAKINGSQSPSASSDKSAEQSKYAAELEHPVIDDTLDEDVSQLSRPEQISEFLTLSHNVREHNLESTIEPAPVLQLLMPMYQDAKDAEDTIEEQRDPPPSPANKSSSETQWQARRVAKFHGSVAIRYLEKIMKRAQTRSYLAPEETPEGRSVWYCPICKEYYASDATCGSNVTLHPSALNPGGGVLCFYCSRSSGIGVGEAFSNSTDF